MPRSFTVRAALAAALIVPGALRAQADSVPADSAPLLSPIVISVSRATQTLLRVPAGVSVRAGADIARGRPGLSLGEVLATVPGINVQQRSSPARDDGVSIRGFGARAAFGSRGVRILLDGIPQTLPDGQSQLTNVDPTDLERVEVLRGASSALYGNAAGGVISLTSRTRPAGDVTPEARLLAGDFGTVAAHAGVAVPLGAGGITLRGSRVETNGFRAQSGAETWRGSLRATRLVGPSTAVSLTAQFADQPRLEDPGALNLDEFTTNPFQPHPAFARVNAGKTVRQGQGGVSLRHDFGGGARAEVAGYGLRRTLDNDLPFVLIDLGRWAWGLRSTVTAPLTGLPAVPVLTLGADVQWLTDDRVNRDPDDMTVERDQVERVRELGPFAQLQVTPHPRLTLTAGARYDAVRFSADDRLLSDGDASGARTMSQVSWTVGATAVLHRLAAPYASVATSFETPTTTELANQPDGRDGFNPALEPQRATQVELGVRGGTGRLRWSLSAYTARVTDALIPFEVPQGDGRRFFRNAGEVRHRGLEAELTAVPARGVEVAVAYTQSDHAFTDFVTADASFTGNRVPGVPARALSATLRAERGRVWLVADTRAQSATVVDDGNTARADPWGVTDLRVGYRLGLPPRLVRAWVGFENVFDAHYAAAVAVNASFGRYYEPGRPRTLVVGVEVR